MIVIRRLWLACALTACNGCSNEPIRYYEAGPLPDAATGDGGGGDGNGGDAAVGSACTPGFTFGAPMAVNGIAAGDKMFGAVTPDELTVAWVTPSGGVMYADRTDSSQAFGAGQTLAGTYEHDRVALGADGLTLIVVMQGAAAFGQVTRAARAQAFAGAPDTTPFAALNATGNGESDGGRPKGYVGDPVLSADGKQLFFSVYGSGNMVDTVALSEKFGAGWLKPVILTQPELGATMAGRRRPTGLSADGKTFFWWDEIDNKEKAGWRKTATSFDLTFSGIVDLGDKKDAQPTAKCTRLYFTNPPAAPSDVKLADKS